MPLRRPLEQNIVHNEPLPNIGDQGAGDVKPETLISLQAFGILTVNPQADRESGGLLRQAFHYAPGPTFSTGVHADI
jgi:hypothetical protein